MDRAYSRPPGRPKFSTPPRRHWYRILNYSKGGRKASELKAITKDPVFISEYKQPYWRILICLGGNDFKSKRNPQVVKDDARRVAATYLIPAINYFRLEEGWLADGGLVRFLVPPPRLDPMYKIYSVSLHSTFTKITELKPFVSKIKNWYHGDSSPREGIVNLTDRVHLTEKGYDLLRSFLLGFILGHGGPKKVK